MFKSATAETRAQDDGQVSGELLAFYEPLARAGTPLVITGNLYVSLQGKSTWRMAGIDADDKLPGLSELTSLVHRRGGLLVAQLNHAGRQIGGRPESGERPVSASDVREPLMGTKPRPLRRDELPGIVEQFAAAAERAAEAGFDGVQIHCAHGYLLSQFLTPHTNRRHDEYGGDLENRMRLILEVVRAVRARVGDRVAVLAKLNGTDSLPLRSGASTEDLVRVARRMQEEGLDGIEISRGHYESGPGMVAGRYGGFVSAQVREGGGAKLAGWRRLAGLAVAPVAEHVLGAMWPAREGFNLPQARRFTEALSIPVICVGGFHTRAAMERAIGGGLCDAVSCARAMIADPLLFQHLYQPDPGAPVCGFCNGCIARAGGRPIDCYSPTVRRQRDRMLAAIAVASEAGIGRDSYENLLPPPPGPVGALTATRSKAGAITATWTPPASDGGAPVTAYEVTLTCSGTVTTVKRTSTSAKFSHSAPGGPCTVGVVAVSADGAGPPESATVPAA